jgi:hypothetical protein
VIHSDKDFVGGDGVLQFGRQGVGIGLLAGLNTEVDYRLKQRLDLRRGDLGNSIGKDERDARAGGPLCLLL